MRDRLESDRCSRVFKALADADRLMIVQALQGGPKDVSQLTAETWPTEVGVLEREEWGKFYGFPLAIRQGERVLVEGSEAVWAALPALLRAKRSERSEKVDSLHAEIRGLNREIERLRRAGQEFTALQVRYEELASALLARETEVLSDLLVMRSADGREKAIPLAHVVRAVRANALGAGGKLALYASRLWEFLAGEPRESNTEGGIFPAIFGTVLMVLLTSLAVAPFGVLTALYLREYARQGVVVRCVRIAVNSLAGVPSIVFGVFGLGFFVYLVGGTIDSLFFADSCRPRPSAPAEFCGPA
jgi:phosphate transport system permease protein